MSQGRVLGPYRLTLLVVLLLLSPVAASSAAQEPTPIFRASPARTGEVDGSAPFNNTTLWTFETDEAVKSSPVVDGGKVYVGTMGGDVLCLDAYTGQLVWSYRTDGPVESSPAVSGDKVYIGSDDGFVYCLDALDGSLEWRSATGGEIKSSPVVQDDMVLVGSNDFNVHCLDATDGDDLWVFETGGYVYSSPALLDGTAYFGSCDGKVYAVDASTGDGVWNFTADFCPASPAVTEDLVIFGAYDGLLHYLNRTDGREVHNVPLRFAEIYSSAGLFTYDHGEGYDLPMVFVATTGGKMVGIGPDGEEFWNRSHDAGITSSPMVVTEVEEPYDPFIIYGDEGGRLHAIEVHNPYVGRFAYLHNYVEWHVQLGTSVQSSPFMWHDRTYVGVETGQGGRVVCIGAIDPATEPYIEILSNDYSLYGWRVTCAIHNMEPDRVTIELEGDVEEAVRKETLPDEPEVYGAGFTIKPPEGLKSVVVRAYDDGELVLIHSGEVMSIIPGWNQVILTVDHPKDGQKGFEGILVASGTVTSNYTVKRVYAQWDRSSEQINCTGAPNWTVALETVHLDKGEHTLKFVAYDDYRTTSVQLRIFIGEEEEDRDVEVIEVVSLLILIFILIALFRTKPPRVSEKASGP